MIKNNTKMKFALTKSIKKEIAELIKDGVDPAEVMTTLTEDGVFHEAYDLFDEHDDLNDELCEMIDQAVTAECERLLNKVH